LQSRLSSAFVDKNAEGAMLAKAFYQQVGQHADLPGRMRRWWSDDVEAGLGRRVVGHDTHQSAASKVIGNEKIRQCRDAKPSKRSGGYLELLLSARHSTGSCHR
jgi:hypothetical protein